MQEGDGATALSAAVAATGECVVVADRERGVVVDATGSIREVFGVARADLIDEPLAAVLVTAEPLADALGFADGDGATADGETRVLVERPSGSRETVACSAGTFTRDGRAYVGATFRPVRAASPLASVPARLDRSLGPTATRTDVERVLCERLAEHPDALFAWVGKRSFTDDAIAVTTAEGDDRGYLDAVTMTASEAVTRQGPEGAALATGDVQFVADVAGDEAFASWREAALERGIESCAAIPIGRGDARYGVAAVYAARPHALGERDRDALEAVAAVAGRVLNAVEHRARLVADRVVELEFEITADDLFFAAASRHVGGTYAVTNYHCDERGARCRVDAANVDPDAFEAFVAEFDGVTLLDLSVGEDGTADAIEVGVDAGSTLFSLADVGATVRTAEASDGVAMAVAEVAASADVGAVVDTLRSSYPDVEVVAKREVAASGGAAARAADALTDRQREVLEAALDAGYFEWPRERSGETLAESLDISGPTFYQHLRTAERKLFDRVLGDRRAP